MGTAADVFLAPRMMAITARTGEHAILTKTVNVDRCAQNALYTCMCFWRFTALCVYFTRRIETVASGLRGLIKRVDRKCDAQAIERALEEKVDKVSSGG